MLSTAAKRTREFAVRRTLPIASAYSCAYRVRRWEGCDLCKLASQLNTWWKKQPALGQAFLEYEAVRADFVEPQRYHGSPVIGVEYDDVLTVVEPVARAFKFGLTKVLKSIPLAGR